MIRFLERSEAAEIIVMRHLLPAVVAHCKKKIIAILSSETYSKEFHAWAATRGDKKDEASTFIGYIQKAMASDRNAVKLSSGMEDFNGRRRAVADLRCRPCGAGRYAREPATAAFPRGRVVNQ